MTVGVDLDRIRLFESRPDSAYRRARSRGRGPGWPDASARGCIVYFLDIASAVEMEAELLLAIIAWKNVIHEPWPQPVLRLHA